MKYCMTRLAASCTKLYTTFTSDKRQFITTYIPPCNCMWLSDMYLCVSTYIWNIKVSRTGNKYGNLQGNYMRVAFMQESWSEHPPAMHLVCHIGADRKSHQTFFKHWWHIYIYIYMISCGSASILIKNAWENLPIVWYIMFPCTEKKAQLLSTT